LRRPITVWAALRDTQVPVWITIPRVLAPASEARASVGGVEADQPRSEDRRLAMLDGLTVDRIADHGDEGVDRGIFGDEALVPRLLTRSNQHQLESAAPDDAAAKPCENGMAVAPIGGIGFRAGGFASIRIGGLVAEADEIEHMDRAGPIVGAEGCKGFLCRVDMLGHVAAFLGKSSIETRGWTLFGHRPRALTCADAQQVGGLPCRIG